MSLNINLAARGRIYNSTGKCNVPGSTIRGVRLLDYDEERDVLVVRGDPVNAPECWFEIELPVRFIRGVLTPKAPDGTEAEEEVLEEIPEDY